MKLDDRDITCERSYDPLTPAELMAEIELYTDIALNSPLRDSDPKEILGPARALLARAEAAEALAYERLENMLFAEQRATDAEVERDELRDANSVLSDALETTRQTLVTLTARAAELEAQLAAQQWRPIDEPAPKGEIEVKMRCAVTDDGGVYKTRTDIFVGWWTSADDSEWRPLPTAPQEPTP